MELSEVGQGKTEANNNSWTNIQIDRKFKKPFLTKTLFQKFCKNIIKKFDLHSPILDHFYGLYD